LRWLFRLHILDEQVVFIPSDNLIAANWADLITEFENFYFLCLRVEQENSLLTLKFRLENENFRIIKETRVNECIVVSIESSEISSSNFLDRINQYLRICFWPVKLFKLVVSCVRNELLFTAKEGQLCVT